MSAYLFVFVPLLLYVVLFLYETYASFKRIGRSGKKGGGYLSATWEVTHTFLIIGLTNFIWLFSDATKEVSRAIYWGLITTGFLFIVRAALYAYIFIVADSNKGKHQGLADYAFAISHMGILAGLAYTLARGGYIMSTINYSVNTQFIPWLWPGLFLVLILGALPLYQLYNTRN